MPGVAFGCSLLGATGLGWGFTWGIFQSYYQVHVLPSTPVSVLGLAGGLMSFVRSFVAMRIANS